jgi:CP family cyanate transporter-like MFS transporter
LTGFAVAVMQPALPSLVRAWVLARVPLGTAVYTNGMVSGATLGPALTIPLVLPWVAGSWRLDLVFWSALIASSPVSLRRSARPPHPRARASRRHRNAGGRTGPIR